jgi:hypothetical protein
MRRFLALAVAITGAAVALGAFAGPAVAVTNGSISVSPSTVPPGGVVHISGSVSVQSCPSSDAATITGEAALFPPDGFGPNAARDSQGDFAVNYTVPVSTPPGTYDVGLRCGGGNVGVSAALTVSAGPVGGPATGAGGTAGGGLLVGVAVGGGLLVLAGALVALRRRLARDS